MPVRSPDKTIEIQLPDGLRRQYPAGVTPARVAADIGPGLARAALGARVGGELVDLNRPIRDDASLSIATAKPDARGDIPADALFLIRHSCAHVMAEAIQRLWPGTGLAYGPPLETGFYYDIDCPHKINEDDFAAIEKIMAEIVAADRPFTRYEMPRAQAEAKLAGDEYKLDNVARAEGDVMSFYATGEPGAAWEDLCRGPHVPSTGRIGAFKLMSVAGAYWHGDAAGRQLQRVYGTAFPDKKSLKAHLDQLEEARKRDHRVLGKQLDLFAIDPLVGPGLVLWLPKGAVVRQALEDFMREQLVARGYDMVFTPHIANVELFKTSGHYPYYADSQFPPIEMRDDGSKYMLKPMNCPHHIMIYKSRPRSYRDLPVRLAEFGNVYRFEQSGELSGMTRVRGFCIDDAHLFVTPDQVEEEFRSTIELVRHVFKTLRFEDVRIQLSLRDSASDKYAGDPADWDRAEATLRRVLQSMGADYIEEIGEAAFYGPKVDFMVRDAIGRRWQLGTVQLDYNLPQRFELEYIGADNQPHRPVMIHRAPFGSLERFVAVLIEHYAGNFPLWLAPVQVAVLPIADAQLDYARKVLAQCKAAGLRAELDESNEKIGRKIAIAETQKIPAMFVVGKKEAESDQVSVRRHGQGDTGAAPTAEAIGELARHMRERS
jgi:threonyl-tRNA synthetase